MRFILGVTVLAVLLLLPATKSVQAAVDIGLSIDSDGVKGFHLAIGDHYGVPEKEVVVVRRRNIPDEELSVVFYLAKRANVGTQAIVKLRLGGNSWMDICLKYGLTAEIFYVPVTRTPGPPYGKAYGHFKNKKKQNWSKIRLGDADIVNFVNLKFMSEHHGYSPDEIIKMREKGDGFLTIHSYVKKHKKQSKGEAKPVAKSGDKKKNKGKGKKK